MNEATLRDFLTGAATARELAADLVGAIVSDGSCVARHPIVDMPTEFTVTSAHLIALCDAFLAGTLTAENLQAIGFCIVASDNFDYDSDDPDGERVAEVVMDWSCPEINYPIDATYVPKWREYLATGVETLRRRDA